MTKVAGGAQFETSTRFDRLSAAMNSINRKAQASIADWDRSDLSEIPAGIAGFQAAVGRGYFPYEIDSAAGGDGFHSAGATGCIGPLRLSRLYASAAFSGFRSPEANKDHQHCYVLMLKESGGDVHFHGKRSCALHVGEVLLLDSRRTLETRQCGSGTSLAMSIPGRLLGSRYANVDDWLLVPLDTSSGAGAVLRENMLCYWRAREQVNATEAGAGPQYDDG